MVPSIQQTLEAISLLPTRAQNFCLGSFTIFLMGIYFAGPFSSADFAAGQKEKEHEAAGCVREVERRGSPQDVPFTPLTILPVLMK